jgi:uncharacterized lipoprotein YddW (UPF0748 family)
MNSTYRFLLTIFIGMLLLSFISGCKEEFTGKREARGVWMSRFDYTQSVRSTDPEAQKAHIRHVFEQAHKARMNMIIFQVRGNADAFYRSQYEPWGSALTGTLGKDPGWDPLQYAIETAHELGLELHAWVNAFPAWRGKEPPTESTPRHSYLDHPQWIVCDSAGRPMKGGEGYITFSPGIPGVREHIQKVVMDIVSKYDIDGIHFDYIRYPEGSNVRGYSHDSVSVARFNSQEANPYKLDFENWEREQVSIFVRNVYNAIAEAKPKVKVSCSPIGKFSGVGWSAYSVVYQDARRWMEEGKMDFVVPMVYYERSHPTHAFSLCISQWVDYATLSKKQVYPGLGAYRAEGQRGWGWDEIWAQIQIVRDSHLPGVVFFAAGSLERVWDVLGIDEFPCWANVPPMPWKDNIPPNPPKGLSATQLENGTVTLRWNPPDAAKDGETATLYNVYRSTTPQIDISDAKNITVILPRQFAEFTDKGAKKGDRYFYCVTALDRMNNESLPTSIVEATAKQVASK